MSDSTLPLGQDQVNGVTTNGVMPKPAVHAFSKNPCVVDLPGCAACLCCVTICGRNSGVDFYCDPCATKIFLDLVQLGSNCNGPVRAQNLGSSASTIPLAPSQRSQIRERWTWSGKSPETRMSAAICNVLNRDQKKLQRRKVAGKRQFPVIFLQICTISTIL